MWQLTHLPIYICTYIITNSYMPAWWVYICTCSLVSLCAHLYAHSDLSSCAHIWMWRWEILWIKDLQHFVAIYGKCISVVFERSIQNKQSTHNRCVCSWWHQRWMILLTILSASKWHTHMPPGINIYERVCMYCKFRCSWCW